LRANPVANNIQACRLCCLVCMMDCLLISKHSHTMACAPHHRSAAMKSSRGGCAGVRCVNVCAGGGRVCAGNGLAVLGGAAMGRQAAPLGSTWTPVYQGARAHIKLWYAHTECGICAMHTRNCCGF
jgi:hypothetical protein